MLHSQRRQGSYVGDLAKLGQSFHHAKSVTRERAALKWEPENPPRDIPPPGPGSLAAGRGVLHDVASKFGSRKAT